MTKFPKTMAAFKTYANDLKMVEGKDLWAVGDGIKADIPAPPSAGRPADQAYHDGSRERLAELSDELAERGYRNPHGEPYTVTWLRELRATCATFPKGRRHAFLSVNLHSEAGNPDVLDWIVANKPKGEITIRNIRMLRDQLAARQQRKASETSGKEEKPPKRKDVEPPADDEEPLTVVSELEVLGMAQDAQELADKAIAQLEEISPDLSKTAIDAIDAEITIVLDKWQKAKQIATKTISNRRARLSVV